MSWNASLVIDRAQLRAELRRSGTGLAPGEYYDADHLVASVMNDLHVGALRGSTLALVVAGLRSAGASTEALAAHHVGTAEQLEALAALAPRINAAAAAAVEALVAQRLPDRPEPGRFIPAAV